LGLLADRTCERRGTLHSSGAASSGQQHAIYLVLGLNDRLVLIVGTKIASSKDRKIGAKGMYRNYAIGAIMDQLNLVAAILGHDASPLSANSP
jgi:hypothetical protein